MPDGSKSQRAYRALRAGIVAGRYSPGYRLVLDRLARELGVSVVPVREAVRRLEAEGLVVYERNVGARVAEIEPLAFQDTMSLLCVVEGAAIAQAMPFLTPEHLVRSREINAEMRATLTDFDPREFTRLNREFHLSLSNHCPNPALLSVVHDCWERLDRIRVSTFSFVPGRAAPSIEEHETILRMVEQRVDPWDIERAMRAHRMKTPLAYFNRNEPEYEGVTDAPDPL